MEPRQRYRNKAYTCGYCNKNWSIWSNEKTHNRKTCPQRFRDLKRMRETLENEDKDLQLAIELSLATKKKYLHMCTICCDDTTDFKTTCGHYFCKECIKKWCDQFTNKTSIPTCPNCKKLISNEDFKRIGAKQKPTHLLPNLPEGWTRHYITSGNMLGSVYYYNSHSGIAQWELPGQWVEQT